MAIDRALLVGGPAKVTYNSVDFYTKEDIKIIPKIDWVEVNTNLYGQVDSSQKDVIIPVPIRLWGAYENLGTIFPTSLLNPVIGTRIYGTADVPLVVQSNNLDGSGNITFPNAQITKLANLHLGVDQSMFSADVEWTALIKNNANPEDVGAYYLLSAGSFSAASFAKTNYKQQRYSAAWGAVVGFSAFQARDGWTIDWELKLVPDTVNGVGTVGMVLQGLVATAKCIPVGPTFNQIDSASKMTGSAMGRLMSTGSADLVITGSGVSITLKNAGIAEFGVTYGSTPLRQGEVTWKTTFAVSGTARALVA
jgi:hypothetical protein